MYINCMRIDIISLKQNTDTNKNKNKKKLVSRVIGIKLMGNLSK